MSVPALMQINAHVVEYSGLLARGAGGVSRVIHEGNWFDNIICFYAESDQTLAQRIAAFRTRVAISSAAPGCLESTGNRCMVREKRRATGFEKSHNTPTDQ
jgi:hypothetical protein